MEFGIFCARGAGKKSRKGMRKNGMLAAYVEPGISHSTLNLTHGPLSSSVLWFIFGIP